MDNPIGVSNFDAKNKQKRNVVVAIALISMIALFFVGFYFIKIKNHQKVNGDALETVKVSALSEDIEDSSIALQRLEKKIKDYEEKLNSRENQIDSDENSLNSYNRLIISLEEKIQALENKIDEMSILPSKQFVEAKTDYSESAEDLPSMTFPSMSQGAVKKAAYFQEGIEEPHQPENSIHIDSFKQANAKHKTAANYIPAGTYVKALLIQGIDASASISSQSDPRPVLMRLTSNGSLPNEVGTHIEDCRLIGAAYGDISSERAFIRLESMSCTLKSKNILESIVDGYIVGEDGKAGIRGVVVRRETDLLTNSFLSGLASGFGSGLSESFDRDLVSPLGVVRETKSADVFKKAGAQGVSNSFERLSKYYIDRAEQFQPVIQVGAGREVDVVFKKGFHLHEGSQPLILAQDK